METLLKLLKWEMETPSLYGWFHLICFALSLAAAVLLCRSHRRSAHSPARVQRVVFYTALLTLALEIYKQAVYHLSYTAEAGLQLNVQWYIFPWQFCSTPMYAGLLTGIFKKGRVHDALCAYLATYAVFAGLCVMLYPGDVFTDVIGVNIQTMICHGSMLPLGIYLYYTGHVRLEHRAVLRALPVFGAFVAMAMLLNEIAHASGLLAAGHTFNMFFISPYCEPSLAVYSTVQALAPYPFCLIIYVLAFTLAAYLVLLAAMGMGKVAAAHRTGREQTAAMS